MFGLGGGALPRQGRVTDTEPFMWARLGHLREHGLRPVHVLDVGANTGAWTAKASTVWPAASFHLVEANPRHSDALSRLKHPFSIAVLGNASGAVTMYEGRSFRNTGNSLFRQIKGSQFFAATRREMITLDSLVARQGWLSEFDLIKLDVQGAELMVLEGAARTLRTARALLLELAVVNYNDAAPMWFETQAAIERRGFRLFDIIGFHYNSKALLIQADALFVRKSDRMWGVGGASSPDRGA